MSTITKERLRERAREKVKSLEFTVTQTAFADTRAELEEELELARIALASLEAEPVCVIDQSNLDYLKSGSDADVWPASRTEMGDVLLYRTAPPAPVSVPAAMEMDDDFDSAFEHGKAVGWNACRSAMLKHSESFIVTSDHRMMEMPQVEAINAVTAMIQGVVYAETPTTMQTAPALDSSPKIAELPSGNSPVSPDGWVACSERMPEDEQEVLTRNKMGHCFVSFFDEHSGLFFDRIDVAAACCIEHILVTHWMPLPAAPQQEVTQALAKGMERYGDAMQKLADSGD